MKKLIIVSAVCLSTITFTACKKETAFQSANQEESQTIAISGGSDFSSYANATLQDVLDSIVSMVGDSTIVGSMNYYDNNDATYDTYIQNYDFTNSNKPRIRFLLLDGCKWVPAICFIWTFNTDPTVPYLLSDGYSTADILHVAPNKLMIRSEDPVINGITSDGYLALQRNLEFKDFDGTDYFTITIEKGIYKAHQNTDGDYDYVIVNTDFN